LFLIIPVVLYCLHHPHYWMHEEILLESNNVLWLEVQTKFYFGEHGNAIFILFVSQK